MSPFYVFLSAFLCSSFAGLASLLRSEKKLTWLNITSSFLNSGMLGMAISLIWYTKYQEANNIFFLVGLCTLAGLAGHSAVDAILKAVFKGGGFKISFDNDNLKMGEEEKKNE